MASSRPSVRSRAASPPKRYGSETPRIFTPPLRKLTPRTSAGFACIEFAEDILDITLIPWQKWLLVHALELLPDGTFRFRTVVLLVARQNGKSTLMQILALFFMYVRGVSLVIGTAQNLDISEEVWQGTVDIAEEIPELSALIERVVKVNGKKSLELRNGERYKVQAANRRGGRGLSGDLVLMDELREHQTWDAWGAVTKTTLARALAQIWAASNAGDAASVVLAFLRRLAHWALGDPDGINEHHDTAEDEPPDEVETEDEDSLGIFEWSAPPGADVWDRDAWAMANPSLGYTITERAIASAARTDPEPVFRTEVLCQFVDGMVEDVFPDGVWDSLRDRKSKITGGYGFAVVVSPDRSRTTIVAAGPCGDARIHVELIQRSSGVKWAPKRIKALLDAWGGEIALDPATAAGSLIPDLAELGIEPMLMSAREVAQASGDFYDKALDDRLRHIGQPELDEAVAGARKKEIGDGGAWKWSNRDSLVDISPLSGATLAAWLVSGQPAEYDVLASAW